MCVTLFFFSPSNKRSNLPSSVANIVIKLLSWRVYVLSLYHLLVYFQWFATITFVNFTVEQKLGMSPHIRFCKMQLGTHAFRLKTDLSDWMFEMTWKQFRATNEFYKCALFDYIRNGNNSRKLYFRVGSTNRLRKIEHCVCRRSLGNLSLL